MPFITRLHGRMDLPKVRHLYRHFPDVPLVSISNAQRRSLPGANFLATIPHGLPIDRLRPLPVAPTYLAFLGRICREKVPDRAIRIAPHTGLPLEIAAKVDKADIEYHEAIIGRLSTAAWSNISARSAIAKSRSFLVEHWPW